MGAYKYEIIPDKTGDMTRISGLQEIAFRPICTVVFESEVEISDK
jgi:hypothetical protein